jgi:hypothetical protein
VIIGIPLLLGPSKGRIGALEADNTIAVAKKAGEVLSTGLSARFPACERVPAGANRSVLNGELPSGGSRPALPGEGAAVDPQLDASRSLSFEARESPEFQ